MKKLIYFTLILSLFYYCGSKQDEIEKIIEDGVEVVLNRIEPYTIKNEPSGFTLEEEFVIDLEREDLAEKGITEIHSFDVDSEGNIYLLCLNNDNNLIFKFNKNGNFIHSFGQRGQGPGEFQDCFYFRINSYDELVVTANYKILIYDKKGNNLKEIRIKLGTSLGTLVDNGNYLFKDIPKPVREREGTMVSYLSLYNSEFKKIKDLDRIEYPDPGSQEIKGTYYKLLWSINANKIYTASQERGYEIYVYDLNGNFLRKVRKSYKKISPGDEYKKRYKENLGKRMYELLRDRIYFPTSLPPFHYFFTDAEGRMFVMTYEKGTCPYEHFYDIFNPDGIFILRKSMITCISYDSLSFSAIDYIDAKIKNNRFYCHSEKENGYMQLVVSKVGWE